MRLRRIEFIAIALTFAFICFMGGYFAGSRGSVSIVAVESRSGEIQQYVVPETSKAGPAVTSDAPPAPGSEGSPEVTETGGSVPAGITDNNTAAAAPSGGETAGALRGGDGRININIASRAELMDLPGIGEVLAGRIVDYRNQYGAFSDIVDIKKVSGIGEKKFEAIKDRITI